MYNVYEPDFYIYYNEKRDPDMVTLGVMINGGTITKDFTIDEWFEWIELNTKGIKRTPVPNYVKKDF